MNTDEYMPMFLAEASEHLQELNLAVVALEDNPGDRGTVDEIFRIAHSLKGMSATMGFAAIAQLTHEMEDVFELLRQRNEPLSHDAIDTVLACLDTLSATFDGIEADGTETLDPTALIERLHALVRARTEEQAVTRSGGIVPPDLSAAAGQRVLHLTVSLDPEVLMPAVRAYMVFTAVSGHGQILGSVPSSEDCDQFAGRVVEVWLTSEHEAEVVAASARGVSDVADVTTEEIDQDATDASEAEAVTEPAATSVTEPAPTAEAEPAPEPPGGPIAATEAPVATADAAQSAEVSPAAKTPAARGGAARTVRVDAERLDALMHAMGELVVHRTAVEAVTNDLELPGLHQAMQELTRSSQALQSMVMQVRMIPVDVVFLRFPRLVRDLSSKLDKDVRLELIGAETELDRTVVDALGDPLVHLVRNSLDHGLESQPERLAAGKPAQGTLQISARHAGGSVVIGVSDDGRGVNVTAVANRALARGLIDAQTASELDMKGAIELLFAAGFSTAEATSDISGRGVGMDVVRSKIREIGGEVIVESTPGKGTSAQIRLPLTLAIVPALHVDIGGAPYAIPLDRIERTLRLSAQPIRSVAGRRMLMLDDGVLPVLDGSRVFSRPAAGEPQFIVIIRGMEQRLALTVDDLVGQRELVTRPLPSMLDSNEAISGGAALADGRIALIVDCDAIAALDNAGTVLPTFETIPSLHSAGALAA